MPAYSITTHVVFRPPTAILQGHQTTASQHSGITLSIRHLRRPDNPSPPAGGDIAITGYMRVRGDFWGVGGARVRHQRVLCHRGVLSRFSAFRKFSPTPLPSVAIPPASNESSPRQPAPTRQTLRLSINDVSALSDLPSDQSVVPTHSTTPRVVFRPPTAILRAGRTPANCHPTPSAGFRAHIAIQPHPVGANPRQRSSVYPDLHP